MGKHRKKRIMVIRNQLCKRCEKNFETHATNAKYCPTCSPIVHAKQVKEWNEKNGKKLQNYKRADKGFSKIENEEFFEIYIPERKYAPHKCSRSRCNRLTTNRLLCEKCIEFADTLEYNF